MVTGQYRPTGPVWSSVCIGSTGSLAWVRSLLAFTGLGQFHNTGSITGFRPSVQYWVGSLSLTIWVISIGPSFVRLSGHNCLASLSTINNVHPSPAVTGLSTGFSQWLVRPSGLGLGHCLSVRLGFFHWVNWAGLSNNCLTGFCLQSGLSSIPINRPLHWVSPVIITTLGCHCPGWVRLRPVWARQ